MKISELYTYCHVPYSNEAAVAVVQSRQGAWFPGVRIENISYPLTIPAVQNALFCCLSEGHQPKKIFIDGHQKSHPILSSWTAENNVEIMDLEPLDEISFYPVLHDLNENKINSKLQLLLDNPFVEHSHFPVSTLIETEKGVISGINIELNDWSHGLCAERVALAKALSYGFTDFKALHLTTLYGEYNSPCGACRQVILEHLPHQSVYLYYADGTRAMHFSSDLLPYSFTSSKLQKQNKND